MAISVVVLFAASVFFGHLLAPTRAEPAAA
jgi:hypothetical protein